MRSPISSYGTKWQSVTPILEALDMYFGNGNARWIDPFCGSCVLPLNLRDGMEVVINDRDSRLMEFWRGLRRGEVDRGYITWRRESWGGTGRGSGCGGVSTVRQRGFVDRVDWAKEKVTDWGMWNVDWRTFLKGVRLREGDVVYFDPPYACKHNGVEAVVRWINNRKEKRTRWMLSSDYDVSGLIRSGRVETWPIEVERRIRWGAFKREVEYLTIGGYDVLDL